MKKNLSLFIGAVAMLGMTPAIAATNIGTRAASSADLSGAPATRDRTKVNYEKYETRTTTNVYDVQDAGNLYYTQPVKRSALYKQYDNSTSNVRTTRSETLRTELKRKYFLAHPFFQPIKGKFGSVTDLSYTMNNFKLGLTAEPLFDINGAQTADAKWSTNQFSIKEDFSYGITDHIALQLMAQYDISKYKLKWSDSGVPDDTDDNNDLNIFGIGGQFRFVDNADWIAAVSAYYQHQKDIANDIILELKAGYKISSSTIYGLVRGWYVDFDGNSYGNGIMGSTPDGYKTGIFFAYKTDADSAFFAEGGLGVFSVLEEDWTLNLEALFGTYDWHNQATLKAAIGWQPNDWFALNLYAKTAIYDSADDKKVGYYYYGNIDADDNYVNAWLKNGDAKISDYKETTIGLQAIFMF